mgnify:CR=1 FL=1
MVSQNDLRLLMLTDLDMVKSLLLTKNDLTLIEFIKSKEEVKPVQVAVFKETNVNNASTKLKKLFEQGYLQRRENNNETGGLEYVYFAAPVVMQG